MRSQRKHLAIILVVITHLTACTNILYNKTLDSSSGLDFTSGTWLMNEVEGENTEKSHKMLTDKLLEGTAKMSIKSIIYIGNVKNRENLPGMIPFIPEPIMLESINESYDFDYLINVKANALHDESGGVAFGEQDLENQASLEIIVFDLKLGKKVYYQEIIATEIWPINDSMEGTPSKFSFILFMLICILRFTKYETGRFGQFILESQ